MEGCHPGSVLFDSQTIREDATRSQINTGVANSYTIGWGSTSACACDWIAYVSPLRTPGFAEMHGLCVWAANGKNCPSGLGGGGC